MLRVVDQFGDYEHLKQMSSQGVVFLMKHSLTCPISAKALHEFESFSKSHSEIPCYIVKIQEARGVSDRIESDTGVKHESPQILAFRKGKVIWARKADNLNERLLKEVMGMGISE